MKRYNDLINDALTRVREILPWDLVDLLASGNKPLVIDVREPSEFEHGHIAGSINVPRGILESSCDWDYEDTIPSLAAERKPIDSGNLSLWPPFCIGGGYHATTRFYQCGITQNRYSRLE